MVPTIKGRATKQIKEEISKVVTSMIGNMSTRADILVVIGDKYKIKRSMIDNYIREARAKMVEAVSGSETEYIADAVYRLKELKARAIRQNDLKTLLGVEKEINRLLIPPSSKVVVTGKNGDPIKLDQKVRIDTSDEHSAEVLRILLETGAIKTGTEDSQQSENK